jgi:hypothetical protein
MSTLHATAADAYTANYEAAVQHLERLQALLASHAERADLDPRNWGFAGDLAAVIGQLDQAAAMLGGAPAA